MKPLTITDNLEQSLRIKMYDNECFDLVQTDKTKAIYKTIILNPREAQEVQKYIEFARKGKIK